MIVLKQVRKLFPFLKLIWADGGYRGPKLAKDFEKIVETSMTYLEVAMIQLMIRRLARS